MAFSSRWKNQWRSLTKYTSRHADDRCRHPLRGRQISPRLELLEERQAPASTIFSSGVLTVDLTNVSEAATLTNNGTTITLSSNNAITGAGSSFPTANVTRVVLTDNGNNASQSITFAGTTAYSLSNGLVSTGVESITFNQAVTATGSAGISVTAPQTILVSKNLTGGTGGTTLIAQGTAALNTVGVQVQSGAVVTATGSGAVTVTGTGGSGSGNNYGVYVVGSGSRITSGGGDVSVTGQWAGGGFGPNYGVYVDSSGEITSGGGDVRVTGQGSRAVSSSAFFDVRVSIQGAIATGINGGNITVVGDSIYLYEGFISAGSNSVTLIPRTNGTAINLGGPSGPGVLGLWDDLLSLISAGTLNIGNASSGAIDVTAAIDLTEGPSIATMNLTSGAAILGSGGNVLSANALSLNAGTTVGSSGDVFALNASSLTTSSSGDQFLSESGSVNIASGNLNAGSGTITLSAGTFVTSPGADVVANLVIGAGVTLAGTGKVTGSTTVRSGGTVSPGLAASILNSGSATFDSGSTFAVAINGKTAGTTYGPLKVTGSVALAGNLVLGGSYIPAPGDSFVIVDNDLGDSVTGSFAGLPEGSTLIYNTAPLRITYAGGASGNDVVLTCTSTLINASNASNNVLIKRSGSNVRVVIDGVQVLNKSMSSLSGLVIRGNGGNDTATIDFSGGNFTIPIAFQGGTQGAPSPGDRLILQGGTFASGAFQFANLTDGSINLSGNSVISYTGLEAVSSILAAATVALNYNGGTETITLSDAAGTNLTARSTAGVALTLANPTSRLTINGGTGDDVVTVASVDSAFSASLTINGDAGSDTVNLNADVTLASGRNLDVSAELIAIGAGVDVKTSGVGTITLTADDVAISATSSLVSASTVTIRTQSVSRAINLGTGSVGQLSLTDAELDRITAATLVIGRNDIETGTVTVSSAVSPALASSFRVVSSRDIVVSANLTGGSGGLDLSANQQTTPTTGSFVGVTVKLGAIVTTTGNGNVTVTGSGGSGATDTNSHGVLVDSAGQITAGGTGTVTVFGSSSSYTLNYGVLVTNSGSTITSGGGNVHVTGRGSSAPGGATRGVYVLSSGIITSSGSGTVTVAGTSIGGIGSFSAGVTVEGSGSQITSGGGAVQVNGQGSTTSASSGSQNYGVHVLSSGMITSGGGAVQVTGQGGGAGSGFSNHGVFVSSFGTITSGGNGAVTVQGTGGSFNLRNHGVALDDRGKITSGGTGAVTVLGTGGAGYGLSNDGVYLSNSAAITSGGGDILVTGLGNGGGGASVGVAVSSSSQIKSGGDGAVTLTGTGSSGGGGTNHGVFLDQSGQVSSGGTGAVTVTGTGGSGSGNNNYGVYLENSGATIASGGSGSVTVAGTGGAGSGSNNYGVYLQFGAAISSGGGAVQVTAQGGGGTNNTALFMATLTAITAANGGNITVVTDSINSTGSINSSNAVTLVQKTPGTAVNLGGADAAGVLGLTDLELDGISAGTLNIGNASSGAIDVTAAIDLTEGPSIAITNLTSGAAILGSGGNLLSTNALSLNAGTTIGAVGDVFALNASSLTTSSSGDQFLSESGGVNIASGNLNAGSGTITLSAGTFFTGPGTGVLANLVVGAGATLIGDVTVTGSITVLSGGTVSTGTGNTPGVVTSGSVSFNSGSTLTVATLGTEYRPLKVTGSVSLGGNLVLNGSYVPVPGSSFVLIDNDLGDAVIGTFAGLAEGATLTYNGTPLTITYAGGSSGNDVVLTYVTSSIDASEASNSILIIRSGNNVQVTIDSVQVLNTLMTNLTALVIKGNGGADTVTVDFSGGNFTIPIVLHGGSPTTSSPGDRLILQGGNFASAAYQFANLFDGSINLVGNPTISYTGLEAMTSSIAAPNVTLNYNGGTEAISLSVLAGTTLTASSTAGTSLTFALPSTALTVNGGSGDDVISLGSLTTIDPFGTPLTLNGGTGNDTIHFGADITFASGVNLDLDLQNDDASPGSDTINLGADTNLIFSGSGAATLKASRSITLASGASIEVVNGSLTIEANQQATATAGDFVGVDVRGGLLRSTGSGIVTVKGKGGTGAGGSQFGVSVAGGGDIVGGSAQLTVLGTGGASTGNNNLGVLVTGSGSTITSAGGNVSVTGLGGSGGSNNSGVSVDGSAQVAAGGSGTVTVSGNGGTGTGTGNHGVRISGLGSTITSGGGNVSVTGNGGGSGSGGNYGVYIDGSALVTAGGTGTVTVSGTGSTTSPSSNYGVHVTGLGSTITSSGGNVSVIALGGGAGGNNNYGLYLDSSALITSGGAGTVTVTGSGGAAANQLNHGVYITGSSRITSGGAGAVTVTGNGGAGNTNYGVYVSGSGSRITSGGGNVSVTGECRVHSGGLLNTGVYVEDATITAGGAGTVTVAGYGGSGTNSRGVWLSGSSSTITSGISGNVSVSGQGGSGGSSSDSTRYGVFVAAGTISSGGAGTVSVTGSLTGTTGSNNHGVYVVSSGKITSGGAGSVTVTGTGWTSFGGCGVLVEGAGTAITSGGGNVSVTGFGSPSFSNNYVGMIGVRVVGGTITSGGTGTVTITGTGGYTTGNANHGVEVSGSGVITSGGVGAVAVNGTSLGSPTTYGVYVAGSSSRITSGGGSVSVTGNIDTRNVTASSQSGVQIESGGQITSSGAGSVTVQGTGGAGSGGSNLGVQVTGSGSRITSGGSGNVSVTGQGGNYGGPSVNNHGVSVAFGGTVTSGGMGTVSVTGTGGIGIGSSYFGVVVNSSGSSITSGGGNVSVTGQGGGGTGSGTANYGVYVTGAGSIAAGGMGTVLVQGSGGTSTGGSAYGVLVESAGSKISSAGGAVQVTGQGGSGPNNTAVILSGTGAVTTAIHGGNITIRGDSMNLVGGSIDAGTGTATLTPKSSGIAINLGGADVVGTLGLSDAELDVVAASTLVIGRNDIATGTVTVSASVSPALASALSVVTSRDIVVGASLTGGSGGLSLSANRQAVPTTGDFAGVTVQAGIVVTTTGNGAVSLAGTGGTGTGVGNHGILINGGIVQAGGSGTVTLAGTGTLTSTAGVRITGGGRITAGGGDSSKSLGLAPGSAILVDLEPTRVMSSGYDYLRVEGTVDLGGASLLGTATGALPFLTNFSLLDNDLVDAVFGSFAPGNAVTLDGHTFKIGYTGGDGNDIILIADEPPTDIPPSPRSVAENLPAGTAIGTLSATDPDVGDSLTYTLVSGSGDADNASFHLDGNGNLTTAASFDFEASATRSIRVRVTDSVGLVLDKIIVIDITDVNEAPVLNASLTPSLTPIPRGASNPAGNSVASLLAGAVTDTDTSAQTGIAVVGLTGAASGTWQFSLNAGVTWQAVGAVTGTAALLLRDTDFVRFVPTGSFVGTATVSYRAWDRTTGVAGLTADVSVNGGSSAFSTNVASAIARVGVTLPLINEDTRFPLGSTVGTLIGALVTDTDPLAKVGMAVFSATGAQDGVWQYSLNNGKTWLPLGSPTASQARLLRSTDQLRFVPRGNFNGQVWIDYRAWDQTVGKAGGTFDLSTAGSIGGAGAFSTLSHVALALVKAVNDAPVLDVGGDPAVTPVAVNASNPTGDHVWGLLGGAVTDVDVGAVQGIAITAAPGSSGRWQYRLQSGTWSDVGAVSTTSALLLRAQDEIRFLPNVGFGGTVSLGYRAWDQNFGTAGTKVAPGRNTAFSVASETARLVVGTAPVNNAPVISTVPSPTLTAYLEDRARLAGDTVASLLGSAVSDDIGSRRGLAVVGLTGTANGTWQFSLDNGTTWRSMGAASPSQALLLRDTDRIRFLPQVNFNGTVAISYAAWDRVRGTAGGRADLTRPAATGGVASFSTGVETATLTIQTVNDAPVLNTTPRPTLSPILPGAANPTGDTVAALLGSAVTDVDAGALKGMAIQSAPNTNGRWQYRLEGDILWSDVGVVSAQSVLLLALQDSIRFLPSPGFQGSVALGYRAWDQTPPGLHGTKVAPGTSTAFSVASESALLTINSVNDRPVLDTVARSSLLPVLPGATTQTGVSVASLVGTRVTDVDPGAVGGIAVTGVTAGGTWYWYNTGTSTWEKIQSVSATGALLLRGQDLVCFVPDIGFRGRTTLYFKAWDQISGSVGSTANTTQGTAFSLAVGALDVVVNAAPVLNV